MDFNELLIVVAFTGLIGIAAFIYSCLMIKRHKEARSWKRAEGTILSSEVDIKLDMNHSDRNYKSKCYKPSITYDFYVNNKRYISSRIYWGDIVYKGWRSSANKVVNKYQVGSKQTVFYNPKNPSQAVLDNKINSDIWVIMTIGSVLIITAIAILIYYFSK